MKTELKYSSWPEEGLQIIDASYEEWLLHVFGHPVESAGWWWNNNQDSWGASPDLTISYLTRTFEEIAFLMKQFSREQIAQGLNYVYSNSCSDISYCLFNSKVNSTKRSAAIQSIKSLYRDCFAPHCASALSHLNEAADNSLNGICYMWWDVLPVFACHKEPYFHDTLKECVSVMEYALSLESDACRESALHGLGEFACEISEVTEVVVDVFLKAHPKLRPELLTYAFNARSGNVL